MSESQMDRRTGDAAGQAMLLGRPADQSEKYWETIAAFEAALKYCWTCGHDRQLEHRVP
jgi:hypothetical protein